ncbi:MAG TPA: phosphotransferase [Glycomyces sp.]|nr:phosphotransferase [Glycomyces sp.]
MATSDPVPLVALDLLAKTYGFGSVGSCRYLSHGLLNRNWRITTEHGAFALKELDDASPDKARHSLALQTRLAGLGVPVVEAVPAVTGEIVPEIDGNAYYLTPWRVGTHPRGEEMGADSAFHMGAVLGRVHRALADPAAGLAAPEQPFTAATTLQAAREGVNAFLGLIAGLADPDEFDTAVVPLLERRLDDLAAHEHLRPVDDRPVGRFGWIHGDCQNWNLLWSGGRIAAVLDWDKIRVRPYGEEIVRAATYQMVLSDGRVDLGNVAALVAGYRTEAAIDAAALADAARRRWWHLLTGVWPLDFHYCRGNRWSDALFFSGDRLTRWWTANLAEVEAAFAGA